MMDFDKALEKAVSEIRHQELKILDDFAKAYLAGMSYTSSKDIAWMIRHLQLNQQEVREETKFGNKYWYSLRDDFHERCTFCNKKEAIDDEEIDDEDN